MTNLHPRTLAALAAGPQEDRVRNGKFFAGESPQDFARRIALIEQEECLKDSKARVTGEVRKAVREVEARVRAGEDLIRRFDLERGGKP